MSKAAVNSLLQRARSKAGPSENVDLESVSPVELRGLVDRFTDTWRSGDSAAMLELLDESSHLTMPPNEMEFSGAKEIVGLLFDEVRFAPFGEVVFREVPANGECGIATYTPNNASTSADRHCIMLFGSATSKATKITGFTEDRVFEILGLPETVPVNEH